MLTRIFDKTSEVGFAKTPPGMAFWIGTGPHGAKCKNCAAFNGEAKGYCRRYHRMTNRKGKRFAGSSAACKYFESATKP